MDYLHTTAPPTSQYCLPVLHGMDLTGIVFSNGDFSDCDFCGCTITGDISGASFTRAQLFHTSCVPWAFCDDVDRVFGRHEVSVCLPLFLQISLIFYGWHDCPF